MQEDKIKESRRSAYNKQGLPLQDMNLSKKSWLYILFFTTLAVLFYVILSVTNSGIDEGQSAPISSVRPFSFTSQDGKAVTDKDFSGKVYAAEFFFTTCKGICPRMNNNMKLVYDAMKEEKDFYILSFTCDPKNDSAAQLKKYADSLKTDTRKWIFITGRKDSLYNAARHSFSIDDPKSIVSNIEDDFLHSQHWALVNQKGDVIGVYDGLKKNEVSDLIKRAKRLLHKSPVNWGLLTALTCLLIVVSLFLFSRKSK